jgi:hypothetical protein
VIEILIPSDTTDESGGTTGPHSPAGALTSRRQSTLSECDRATSHEESSSFAASDDPAADDTKPKIILHLPKKKSATTRNFVGSKIAPSSATTATPLSRLSLDELRLLSQLSEKDLKDSLLKALDEKNPT